MASDHHCGHWASLNFRFGWFADIVRLKKLAYRRRMALKFATLQAIIVSVALAGCSAQYPFDGVRFCLSSMDEAAELKAILGNVSEKHGLSLVDESMNVQNDLETLENPLARKPILYILINDKSWLPKSGPIMINNIGASSPREVGVSFFRSSNWLGSDEKTDEITRDVVDALSRNWTLSDHPGFRLEGELTLC